MNDDSASADLASPRKPAFRVDLDVVRETRLRECGACDYGLLTACVCPDDDYRPTLSGLVDEVERVRQLARDLATSLLVFAELGGMPDTYWSTDSRVEQALWVLDLAPDAARALAQDAVSGAS
jgi:hypothetical protein